MENSRYRLALDHRGAHGGLSRCRVVAFAIRRENQEVGPLDQSNVLQPPGAAIRR